MTTANTHVLPVQKPLRLWPGVLAATLVMLVTFILPVVAPRAQFFGMDGALIGVIGGMVGSVAILAWWTLFSRARWTERLGALAMMILAMAATRPLTHMSIQNGMMGMMFVIYGLPTAAVALVAWALASGRLSGGSRWAAMAAALLIGTGVWTLARTNGLFRGSSDLAWRWTPTAEDRLLAQAADAPADSARVVTDAIAAPAAVEVPNAPAAGETANIPATSPTASTPASNGPVASVVERRAEWPSFRGPDRDGVVSGVRIKTDWPASPPVEMWRRAIGPGWSSFAVSGDVLYTQEQRGDEEIVASYKVSTGEPVWRHRDKVRFWESNGGAGPRATPTLSGGRVYAFGATGIVNALDAATGKVVWSRNAAADTGHAVPDWGFAGSPLVIDDLVIVAASGSLVGYELSTGKPRWFGPSHDGGYSSPHRATIDGVTQVLLLSGYGATSVAPADGALLWEHQWAGSAIVQPALTADGNVVINTIGGTGGVGTRRLAVARGPGGWSVEERWTSNGLKPYFNDFVIHKGHAFGFDGSILACIDLNDGKRKWKGGRYGNGQLVLLRDQDLLLVLSEEGEMALVSATPDQFKEIAEFPALNGKTWNHPVLVGDVLLVRNGEEMAAFRMPLEGR